MSKLGHTKKQIFDSLRQKSKTVTMLSDELNLAHSTVIEHIQGLLDMGAIREVDDIPRKWRYYEVNPEFVDTEQSFLKRYKFVLMGVVALAVIGVVYYYLSLPSTIASTCSPAQGYTCTSPVVTSSGMLSMAIGGFSSPAQITSIGCSYGSSPPTSFTPVNVSIAAGASADVSATCPTQPYSGAIAHIWINYTSANHVMLVQVAQVAIGGSQSTSSSVVSTVSSTTIVTSTTSMTTTSSSSTTSTASTSTTTIQTSAHVHISMSINGSYGPIKATKQNFTLVYAAIYNGTPDGLADIIISTTPSLSGVTGYRDNISLDSGGNALTLITIKSNATINATQYAGIEDLSTKTYGNWIKLISDYNGKPPAPHISITVNGSSPYGPVSTSANQVDVGFAVHNATPNAYAQFVLSNSSSLSGIYYRSNNYVLTSSTGGFATYAYILGSATTETKYVAFEDLSANAYSNWIEITVNNALTTNTVSNSMGTNSLANTLDISMFAVDPHHPQSISANQVFNGLTLFLNANVTNGKGPYTYNWIFNSNLIHSDYVNSGIDSILFSGNSTTLALSPDSIKVSVTSSNGMTGTSEINITVKPHGSYITFGNPGIVLSSGTVTGSNSITATANFTGDTGPFTYYWYYGSQYQVSSGNALASFGSNSNSVTFSDNATTRADSPDIIVLNVTDGAGINDFGSYTYVTVT